MLVRMTVRMTDKQQLHEVTPVSVCLLALIKYIRPVFVSRSDQDSRRKTVEEIKRRARSGGEWPQVPLQLTETSPYMHVHGTLSEICSLHTSPNNTHIYNITFFVS